MGLVHTYMPTVSPDNGLVHTYMASVSTDNGVVHADMHDVSTAAGGGSDHEIIDAQIGCGKSESGSRERKSQRGSSSKLRTGCGRRKDKKG
jgi:hypothetical protein